MFARFKSVLQSFAAYRAVRFGWHFTRDPVFRRDHLLLWRRPRNLFQHRSITTGDRYPEVFAFLRSELAGRPGVRLLSFGCATGEEVFSLRRAFPAAAFVKGIDINPANIATCRARHRAAGADPAIVFEENDTVAAEPAAACDAVLCMAVFVRWQLRDNPAIATSAPHLRFADFARTMAELAATVRPGGFLVVRHAMFRFADTAAARDFTLRLTLPTPARFPAFGPDDRRLPDAPAEGVVFQKRAAADRA